MKYNLKIKKIIISIIIFLTLFSELTFISAATDNTKVEYKEVVNNREPRIHFKRNDKNYLYILLHDDAGLTLSKTYFLYEGNRYKVELIEHNIGAYTAGGKRFENFKPGEYTGKRYDYGIKLKYSDLSTDFKSIFVFSYDYWGGCFLKETFKIKKLQKADKDGSYYRVDCAPRVTVHLIDGKPMIDAIDYSGIKSIKIISEYTKDNVYSYSVETNSTSKNESESANAVTSQSAKKKGYVLKEGVYYPIRVREEINMNIFKKSGVGNERYKIRVTAEDKSGIKNEKTMITRISTKKEEKVKKEENVKKEDDDKQNTELSYGENLAIAACRLSYSSYKTSSGKILKNSNGYYGTKLYRKYRNDGNKPHGCCSRGMSTVVNAYLKYDTGLKKTSAKKQYSYMAKSSKWKKVGTYKSGMENKSSSILKPGDIVISKTHTCMYVGNKIPVEVYEKYLKGTDADYGRPKSNYVWVTGRWHMGLSLCICNKEYSAATNGGVIYRYVGK